MKSKILFGLSLLLALAMINSGFNKFLHYMPYPPMPDEAVNFLGTLGNSWVFKLVAIAEIIGGVLLIMPKTRALGAIILFPVVVGILLFHIAMDPASILFAVIIFAILAWIIYENREKYMPMIQD